jgi:hypothetical protein
MTKKVAPKKVGIEKTDFDLDSFLESENFNSAPTDKDLTWIPLSKGWHDALKLPGFPRGFVSLVRGYSNTGKSTAFYEAIVGAQKIGDFPIVIETEGNWNNEHAKMVGVKFKEVVNEETGEITEKPDGFLLVKSKDLYTRYKNYNHKESKMATKPTRNEPVIEDVALFINQMIQKQEDGELNKNICFLWDSIGTLNGYQSATSNSANNQWNAGSMNAFQSIVNFKIPSSRDVESKFTNTFICVQKIWLDNMNGTVVRHKGGEFMFFSARIIVHIGGILTHGTTKLKATALGHDFQYGTRAKIKCEKNHVTGIERQGEIASTPHGYVNPDELDEYKKEHRQFIHDSLNVDFNTTIEYDEEEGELNEEDKRS